MKNPDKIRGNLMLTIKCGDHIKIGEGQDCVEVHYHERKGNSVTFRVNAPLGQTIKRKHGKETRDGVQGKSLPPVKSNT